MSKQWHCAVNGQQYGPISEEELRAWVSQGRVTYHDMVWTEGMGAWKPLQEVQYMFAGGPPIPPGGGSAGPVPGTAAGGMYAPHNGTLIMVLGILSLFVATPILGPVAWIMGNKELAKIDAGLTDPSGRGQVNAGRICGMIASILSIVVILFVCVIFMIAAAAEGL